jgi:hypothetical protein
MYSAHPLSNCNSFGQIISEASYVQLTISQPTLKESTPGRFQVKRVNATWTKSEYVCTYTTGF